MRTDRRLACLGITALTLLAMPAFASAAKPLFEVRPKGLELELRAEASKGYAASVETVGHKQVVLTVEGHGGSASYQVDGHVSRHGIEADFGELGHISVHFEGKPAAVLSRRLLPFGPFDKGCKGRKPVREEGTFRGAIEFEGEHGFTKVDATRAKGKVRRSYRQVCRRAPQPASGKPSAPPGHPTTTRLVELLAAQASPTRRTFLAAINLESNNPLFEELLAGLFPLVGARVIESSGTVLITRLARGSANAGAFLVSPPGGQTVTATLAPAKPFSGTAKFSRLPGSPPSLIGSLAVRMPGGGTVAVAGPGFITRFCRAAIEDAERCMQDAAAEIGFPLDD